MQIGYSPLGGAAGQAVVRGSDTAGDTAFTSTAGAGAGLMVPEKVYVPGLWYDNRLVAGPLSVASVNAGWIYYLPAYTGQPVRIDGLGSATGGTFAAGTTVAVYGSQVVATTGGSTPAAVVPAALLVSGQIAGAGAQTVTVPATTIGPGWLFLTLLPTATAANQVGVFGTGVRRLGFYSPPTTAFATTYPVAYYRQIQATLPATATPVAVTSSVAPLVWFRAAA